MPSRLKLQLAENEFDKRDLLEVLCEYVLPELVSQASVVVDSLLLHGGLKGIAGAASQESCPAPLGPGKVKVSALGTPKEKESTLLSFVEGGLLSTGMSVSKVKLMSMHCSKSISSTWLPVMYFNSGDWPEAFRSISNRSEELERLVTTAVCGRGTGLLM